ncbi:MAG: LapA family protein [bacterium]|nr:LapA family protein [bacterium]
MPMLRRVLLVAIVIALIVVVRLFPDHNESRIDIDLLLTNIEGVSLWFALVATFLGGALIAFAISSLLLIKARLVGRRYRKAVADLEAEVHHLRNLPLASGDLQGDLDAVIDVPAKGG